MAVHVYWGILEGKLQIYERELVYTVNVARTLYKSIHISFIYSWDLQAILLPTKSKAWSHQQQMWKENPLMETAKARQVSLMWK